ncbi:hypothetical protein [Caulobacter sp. UNC358MFTsu5.1]|uniref:hypothetical protein n=1 Tax=Caulobacter sp. UNC358MFTsu5.1 TaxID=1449049 RepID=UPI0004A6BE42|nr:hypothetical protein [Caulobacter sp. UNC358MFTsu5.1]
MRLALTTAALITLAASAAQASTPGSWNDLRVRSDKACIAAAQELRNVRITAYGDTFQSVTVSSLEGVYRPKHMKGARGKATCVFDKRSGRAEVQELQVRR